jgi:hypothetical protein
VNDISPPSVRLLTRTVKPGARLRLAVTDSGSGVDPQSLVATVDGKAAAVRYGAGRATVMLAGVAGGTHRVAFEAADYQELKNMENVPQILPNTRSFTATFTVR